jgi:hypothetical protein
MARDKEPKRDERDVERDDPLDRSSTDEEQTTERPNPPRTTTGVWTFPEIRLGRQRRSRAGAGPREELSAVLNNRT